MPKGVYQVFALVCVGACVATAVSAKRRSATPGGVPAAAVGYHGAWELYRTLAVFFGKQALRAEASYWEVIRNGG